MRDSLLTACPLPRDPARYVVNVHVDPDRPSAITIAEVAKEGRQGSARHAVQLRKIEAGLNRGPAIIARQSGLFKTSPVRASHGRREEGLITCDNLMCRKAGGLHDPLPPRRLRMWWPYSATFATSQAWGKIAKVGVLGEALEQCPALS